VRSSGFKGRVCEKDLLSGSGLKNLSGGERGEKGGPEGVTLQKEAAGDERDLDYRGTDRRPASMGKRRERAPPSDPNRSPDKGSETRREKTSLGFVRYELGSGTGRVLGLDRRPPYGNRRNTTRRRSIEKVTELSTEREGGKNIVSSRSGILGTRARTGKGGSLSYSQQQRGRN